jgi:hypothetical protein
MNIVLTGIQGNMTAAKYLHPIAPDIGMHVERELLTGGIYV